MIYFNLIPFDINYMIISKLNAKNYNNFINLLNNKSHINYEYLAKLKFGNDLTDIKKEFPSINDINYNISLITYNLKQNINEFSNIPMINIYTIIELGIYVNDFNYYIDNISLLPNINKLYIYFNEFDTPGKLFNNISKLINIRKLIIHNIDGTTKKYIEKIPKSIGELKNLEKLHIYGHSIEYISKEIGNLTKLRKLSLSNNLIQILPKEIGNLINLECLDLSYNRIIILPEWLIKLSSLKKIKINNNLFNPYEDNNINILYILRNKGIKISNER
jgi:Leucine-rich repeat (LRR) protein